MFSSKANHDSLARELYKSFSIEIDPKASHKQDRFGSNWNRQLDLGLTSLLLWGQIVDTVSYLNMYRVQIENGSTVWCSYATRTGLVAHGVRDLTTLPVGSSVYIIWHPRAVIGTIVCVDPPYMTDFRTQRSDFISQASRCGLFVDFANIMPFGLMAAGGLQDTSCGRPVDGLMAGDTGEISYTGLLNFIDPFMIQLRVDEETGISAFYADQLLRMAGHNLQVRSSLGEREDFDDQFEISRIEGIAGYYHETLGAFRFIPEGYQPEISRKYTQDDLQKTRSEYSALEPKFDDQQPFYRKMRFEGYLGQGGHEIIALPVVPETPEDINRYSVQRDFIGVFQDFKSFDGAWSVRSAKRIIFSKQCVIPVPKQMKRPEDYRGDNETNYKSASIYGNGPIHQVTDGAVTNFAEQSIWGLIAPSDILDIAAHAFNWEPYHPFYYHQLDWYLPESGTNSEMPCAMRFEPFSNLRFSQYMTAPEVQQAFCDERYAGVRYYPNMSFFGMLEDGSILLADGYGGEIKMAAGSIFISAPGDVWLQPGKNLNSWAGYDIIERANNSIEMSTTLKSIRMAAQENVMVLAGKNGQCGGILLQSDANAQASIARCMNEYRPGVGPADTVSYNTVAEGDDTHFAGVVVRCPNSGFYAGVGSVYMTSTVSTGYDTAQLSGSIVLEADNYLKLFGSRIHRKSIGEITQIGNATSYWSPTENFISAALLVQDDLCVAANATIGGCMTVYDWIRVANGHIATSQSSTYGGTVPSLSGDNATNAIATLQACSDHLVAALAAGPTLAGPTLYPNLQTFLGSIHFTFRNDEQYATNYGLVLFESRWQQLARLTFTIPSVWRESHLKHASPEFAWPFPGYLNHAPYDDNYTPYRGFRTIDPEFYTQVSTDCGNYKPRTTPSGVPDVTIYEANVLQPSVAWKLQGNYAIIPPSYTGEPQPTNQNSLTIFELQQNHELTTG